jgi:hypothetical protein
MKGPLLTMVVLCGCPLVNGNSLELRPGRATRGKWRIPDGRVRERSIVMFGALKVVALTYVD